MGNTLQQLEALLLTDPETQWFLERRLAFTYDAFLAILHKDIDRIVQKVEDRKQIYCDSLEDPISMFIVDMLEECGYEVVHDPKIGGHVDFLVRGRAPGLQWLGEAKRDYKGIPWIDAGMQQLCFRYASGGKNNNQGGLFVYCQKKDAANTVAAWRAALQADSKYENLTTANCAAKPKLAFYSTHTHETSGLPYTVRHIGIGLYHKPTK